MAKYYGVAEIAEKLGVGRSAVTNWIARGQVPEPAARLAMGPVWINTPEFRAWLKKAKKGSPTNGLSKKED